MAYDRPVYKVCLQKLFQQTGVLPQFAAGFFVYFYPVEFYLFIMFLIRHQAERLPVTYARIKAAGFLFVRKFQKLVYPSAVLRICVIGPILPSFARLRLNLLCLLIVSSILTVLLHLYLRDRKLFFLPIIIKQVL